MHTYRKQPNGHLWEVGHYEMIGNLDFSSSQDFNVNRRFNNETEAAAYVNYLNGGEGGLPTGVPA